MLRCMGGSVILIAASLSTNPARAQPAVVDFDDPASLLFPSPFGDSFGNTTGQVVISQDGIDISVERFFLGKFSDFFRAEIDGPFPDSFPTLPFELDNINARFDFSDVGFAVTQVTFEYEKLGPSAGVSENFAINDGTILQLNINNLPEDIATGVTASVEGSLITLSGPISSFLIGGQELIIDNVTAVPEPATLLLLATAGALVLRRRRS